MTTYDQLKQRVFSSRGVAKKIKSLRQCDLRCCSLRQERFFQLDNRVDIRLSKSEKLDKISYRYHKDHISIKSIEILILHH